MVSVNDGHLSFYYVRITSTVDDNFTSQKQHGRFLLTGYFPAEVEEKARKMRKQPASEAQTRLKPPSKAKPFEKLPLAREHLLLFMKWIL